MESWGRILTERYPLLKKFPAWVWWAVALVVFGILAIFWDVGQPVPADSTDPFAPVEWGMFVGVLLKLGVVIALIYIGLYALRRWKIGSVDETGSRLTVVETVRLSPRQSVHVLRLDTRRLIVGATDQSVTLLAQWEEDDGEYPETYSEAANLV